MADQSVIQDWEQYPTGKIAKGAWCPTCARFNVRNSTVEVVLFDAQREHILLILRAINPQKGFWGLPGGYVGWDETLEQAAIREAKEETGYDVASIEFFQPYSSPTRDADGRQNIGHCFVAIAGEKTSVFDHEIKESRWFRLNELPKEIAFDHGQMIADVLAKKKI